MSCLTIFLASKTLLTPNARRLRFDYTLMILGIVLSVAVVSASINLFEGYKRTIKSILLDCYSHIVIEKSPGTFDANLANQLRQQVDNRKQIKSMIPSFSSTALIRNGNMIRSCIIKAYPVTTDKIWYERYIMQGASKPNVGSIVVGARLLKDFALKIGDKTTLLYPISREASPVSSSAFRQEYRIRGVVRTGFYEIDKSLVIMNASDAFTFYGIKPVYNQIEILLHERFVEKAASIAKTIGLKLGSPYYVSSWIDINGNLFSLINIEKWLIFLVFSFLILIASLNCVSIVSASVIEHKKEIAILQTIGLTMRQTNNVFYLRLLSLGILSIIAGMLSGTIIAWAITRQTFYHLKGDVYFIDKINMQVSPVNYIILFVISVIFIAICIKMPLKQLNKLQVIEILRGK
jgi:lipoprotein-releasing system permease protein